MESKPQMCFSSEQDGKMVTVYCDTDMKQSALFDALMEIKGAVAESIMASHQQEKQQMEQFKQQCSEDSCKEEAENGCEG